MIGTAGCWGLLKTDQLVADTLIWPSRGAQFVEVGPIPDNPDAVGGPMMIVVGGLNRKSGTGAAAALMPALTVGHTRVFSLIYGSGINDQDILDKFDALTSKYQPREVSFFGSSMGGDVVLDLAAHAQDRRDSYRQDLLAPLGARGHPVIPRDGYRPFPRAAGIRPAPTRPGSPVPTQPGSDQSPTNRVPTTPATPDRSARPACQLPPIRTSRPPSERPRSGL